MSEVNISDALIEFIGAFEVVFRYDWEYTKIMIGDEAAGATFLEPGLDDESEDWAARGALLERYRALVGAMQSQGLEPKFPFPQAQLQSLKGPA
ncbi:hypothetical protein [Duganella vulcania]|uniref:Uncharacterized protein n=1 Tax=Duganella vulcania TaxID=2692166 RepID=A0A845GP70_9BURK|nr:hypothetical protein [Duganella vulcania]MYM95791.1 hypothetical protein [Duganella vulcania]